MERVYDAMGLYGPQLLKAYSLPLVGGGMPVRGLLETTPAAPQTITV